MYKSQNSNKQSYFLFILLFFLLLTLSVIAVFLFLDYQAQKQLAQNKKINLNKKNNIKISERDKKVSEENKELTIKDIEQVEQEEKEAILPLIVEEHKQYGKLLAADGRETLDTPYIVKDIWLINRRHRVNWNFKPPLASNGLLTPEAWSAYQEMQADAKKDNITFFIRSAYRSFAKQYDLYNYYVRTDPGGIAKVDTYSAPPGASEHQSGLALDLDNGNGLSNEFDLTPAGKWLHENAYKYGFIIRFPKDKQHITGYQYEPWHFRFVGKEAAQIFGASNSLTLEEYLEALPAPAPVYNAKGEITQSIELDWQKERNIDP